MACLKHAKSIMRRRWSSDRCFRNGRFGVVRFIMVLMSLWLLGVISGAYVYADIGFDDRVFWVQQRLKSLGYDPGPVDGQMGENTNRALLDFQRIKGLEADGRLSQATLAALGWGQAQQMPEVYVQTGHANSVMGVAVSPDQRYVLSASGDKSLKLWERESGRLVRTLQGHTSTVTSVVFSHDGKYALSGSCDHTLKLWDYKEGYLLKTFRGHKDWVTEVALTPDGKMALSASRDKSVKLWDVQTGHLLKTLQGHKKYVESIAVSPDGRYALSGGWDKLAILWDLQRGEKVKTYKRFQSILWSVAFSPDGRLAVTSQSDEAIVWELETGRKLKSFDGHRRTLKAVSFSPDGNQLLTASVDGTAKLWDAASGRVVRTFAGYGQLLDVGFSGDGQLVVAGGSDGIAKLWDAASGRPLQDFDGDSSRPAVDLSSDGRYAITGTTDSVLSLWGLDKGGIIRRFSAAGEAITRVIMSPDGGHVVAAGKDGKLVLWEIASGRQVQVFDGRRYLSGIVFSQDGKSLFLASSDKASVSHWDVGTGQHVGTLHGRKTGVDALAVSPDGRLVLAGGWELTLWDIASGQMLRTFEGNPDLVFAIDFSPDGRFAVTGSEDGIVRLWDVKTGRLIRKYRGHRSIVSAVRFSQDGKQFLSGSWDYRVHLWDRESGGVIRTFRGHVDGVAEVAFTADEGSVIARARDGSSIRWRAADGEQLAKYIQFGNGEWITIIPEGYFKASPMGHELLNVRLGSDVYSINQFYDAFYRPDLVEKKLAGESIADFTHGLKIGDALKRPPPKVALLSPRQGAGLDTPALSVEYRVEDMGGGIGDIRVYHNGKLVGSRGVYRLAAHDREATPLASPKAQGELYQTARRGVVLRKTGYRGGSLQVSAVEPLQGVIGRVQEITLLPGDNNISVVAFNRDNTVMSALASVTVHGRLPERKPRLFALVVGNDHFRRKEFELFFAGKDARDFSAMLTETARPLFDAVEVVQLLDADKTGVVDAIGQVTGKMWPEDVFIFYVASHGRAEDDLYYIYMSDFDGDLGKQQGFLTSIELMELSKAMPALRQAFFLDTCQAGGMGAAVSGLYDARITVLAKAMGLHVIAGAKDYQSAIDDYQGNGLFTHFLLQALGGEADTDRNRHVDISEMAPFLRRAVFNASGGSQAPYIRTFGEDFSISRVK